jgi:hypothetical protein
MPGLLSRPRAPELHGVQLAAHIVEILVTERLFRDLRAADERNRALASLDRLVEGAMLSAEQRDNVLRVIGWRRARRVEIVQVRPLVPLPGDPLAGFTSRSLRELYLDEGRAAADRALHAMSVDHPRGPDATPDRRA